MGKTLVITVAHTSLERAIGSWVAVYVSLAESTTDNLTGQAGTTFRKNYQERKDLR